MDTKQEYYLWTVLMVLSYIFAGYMVMEIFSQETIAFYNMFFLLGAILLCHFTTSAFLTFNRYK